MIFPDGTVKEGQFENNVYKGPASSINGDQSEQNSGRSGHIQGLLKRVQSREGSGSLVRNKTPINNLSALSDISTK